MQERITSILNDLLNFQIDVMPLKDPPSYDCTFCGSNVSVDLIHVDGMVFCVCKSCAMLNNLKL